MARPAAAPHYQLHASEHGASCSLFIKALSKGTTERHLHFICSQFGEVKEAQIARHRSGRSAGFAIVTFERQSDAERALSLMDGSLFLGRRLMVRWFLQERDAAAMQAVTLGPGCHAGNLSALSAAELVALATWLSAADAPPLSSGAVPASANLPAHSGFASGGCTLGGSGAAVTPAAMTAGSMVQPNAGGRTGSSNQRGGGRFVHGNGAAGSMAASTAAGNSGNRVGGAGLWTPASVPTVPNGPSQQSMMAGSARIAGTWGSHAWRKEETKATCQPTSSPLLAAVEAALQGSLTSGPLPAPRRSLDGRTPSRRTSRTHSTNVGIDCLDLAEPVLFSNHSGGGSLYGGSSFAAMGYSHYDGSACGTGDSTAEDPVSLGKSRLATKWGFGRTTGGGSSNVSCGGGGNVSGCSSHNVSCGGMSNSNSGVPHNLMSSLGSSGIHSHCGSLRSGSETGHATSKADSNSSAPHSHQSPSTSFPGSPTHTASHQPLPNWQQPASLQMGERATSGANSVQPPAFGLQEQQLPMQLPPLAPSFAAQQDRRNDLVARHFPRFASGMEALRPNATTPMSGPQHEAAHKEMVAGEVRNTAQLQQEQQLASAFSRALTASDPGATRFEQTNNLPADAGLWAEPPLHLQARLQSLSHPGEWQAESAGHAKVNPSNDSFSATDSISFSVAGNNPFIAAANNNNSFTAPVNNSFTAAHGGNSFSQVDFRVPASQNMQMRAPTATYASKQSISAGGAGNATMHMQQPLLPALKGQLAPSQPLLHMQQDQFIGTNMPAAKMRTGAADNGCVADAALMALQQQAAQLSAVAAAQQRYAEAMEALTIARSNVLNAEAAFSGGVFNGQGPALIAAGQAGLPQTDLGLLLLLQHQQQQMHTRGVQQAQLY